MQRSDIIDGKATATVTAKVLNEHFLQIYSDWRSKSGIIKVAIGDKPTEYKTLAMVYGYAQIPPDNRSIWLEVHAEGNILSRIGNSSGDIGLIQEAYNPDASYEAVSGGIQGGCIATGFSAELSAVNTAHRQLNTLATKLKINIPAYDRVTSIVLISNKMNSEPPKCCPYCTDKLKQAGIYCNGIVRTDGVSQTEFFAMVAGEILQRHNIREPLPVMTKDSELVSGFTVEYDERVKASVMAPQQLAELEENKKQLVRRIIAEGKRMKGELQTELVQEWVEKHNDEWIRAGHTGADIKIATKKCIGWISTLTSPIAAALMSSMPISAATPHTKVDQPEIKKIDAEALKGWSTLGDNDKQARLLKILKYLPSETYKTIQKDSGLSFNLITRLSSSRLVSKGTLDKIKKVIEAQAASVPSLPAEVIQHQQNMVCRLPSWIEHQPSPRQPMPYLPPPKYYDDIDRLRVTPISYDFDAEELRKHIVDALHSVGFEDNKDNIRIIVDKIITNNKGKPLAEDRVIAFEALLHEAAKAADEMAEEKHTTYHI